MNEFPQSAFIAAVRNCPLEGAFDAAATRTLLGPVSVHLRIRRQDAFPAHGTDVALYGMNPGQAAGTNGETGDVQQWLPANAAIGREENREETFGSAADGSL
jgi:hypothetical protein